MICLGPRASIAVLNDYLSLPPSNVVSVASGVLNCRAASDSYCRNDVAYPDSLYCYHHDPANGGEIYCLCAVVDAFHDLRGQRHCDCGAVNVWTIRTICDHHVPMCDPSNRQYADWMRTASSNSHEPLILFGWAHSMTIHLVPLLQKMSRENGQKIIYMHTWPRRSNDFRIVEEVDLLRL